MISNGLNDAEQAKLQAAGFSARLIKAVTDEAATMRLLALRRQSGSVWTGIAAAFGAIVLGVLQIFGDSLGWLVTTLIPLLGGALAAAPWLEVRMMRQHEPVRWAARRLAVLAVTANPDNGGDDAWKGLVRHALQTNQLDSPRSALRHLARDMIREETGTDPRNPAPNRTMTVDQSQLSDTLWRAVAAIAALTLIALLAVRVFLG